MDKLKMQTPNRADENFKKLAALFPNAVTETVDENGVLVRAIDKDVLMQEINTTVVDGKDERYQFTWPDKKKSVLLANAPIAKTLRPCPAESMGKDGTPGGFDSENLYIEGDNLEVLKLLQETYLGEIKMIYIDPPYNTGNDFVYEDAFAQSTEEYLANSGQYDEEGNRLVKNMDTNGRFHTDWLNMIYPRLKLAKDLLSDEGVVFISVDDNELVNLSKVCEEVFSSSNRIAIFVVASNSSKNNAKYVSITHEYLLCYAKDKSKCPFPWKVRRSNDEDYKKRAKALLKQNMSKEEMHEQLLALTKYPKFYEFDHFTYVDEHGIYQTSDLTAPGSKNRFEIIHPITGKACVSGTRGWAYPEDTIKEFVDKKRIEFGENETTIPRLKNYLQEDGNDTVLAKSVLFFDSQGSTKWMKAEGLPFDYPKAIEFIKYVISLYPYDHMNVMDFFSGSATTAHAVMQLNAEDGGNRRFIMVQLPEETDEKSEAYKAGYKNICEIGKERIRRAGAKIKEENPLGTMDLDVGFRVLKCETTNMKNVYYHPDEYNANLFDMLEDNIKEDRTPEDLLFQVMLDLGVLLSSKIEQTEIAGKKVFNVADNFLIACFDANVTEETITAIAKQKPYYFVMRDSSLANDSVAANFDQIFATYSPDTVRKVL